MNVKIHNIKKLTHKTGILESGQSGWNNFTNDPCVLQKLRSLIKTQIWNLKIKLLGYLVE
jgi:hypothetical protein